jgi:hypothetical protein
VEAFPVTLPHGLWRDGERCTLAVLRGITGADEALLIDYGVHLSIASRTTQLLERCLTRIEGVTPIDAAVVRDLTVGDREALLLQLRAQFVGDQLDAVIECPTVECGEKIEVELSIADILQEEYDDAAAEYEEAVGAGDTRRLVRFRLPTGGDQEAIAPLARSDIAGAARALLERCVLSVAGHDPGRDLDEIGDFVVTRWEHLDPQAETILRFVCPNCGSEFETSLDAGSFLFEELAARSAYLFHEVDALAKTYHWTEAEILSLSPQRRRRYVELLTGASL